MLDQDTKCYNLKKIRIVLLYGGLYGGHPVYPRLFKATWKDKLQITPNAVVVMGESAHKDNSVIIAKASHGLLQGRFW